MASILRSDLVLVENDCHKMYLTKIGSFDHTIILPTMVEEGEINSAKNQLGGIDLKKQARKSIAFEGDFSHEDDFDNFNFLIQNIWPKLVEKDPDLKLDVFGHHLTKKVLDLCSSAHQVRPVVK